MVDVGVSPLPQRQHGVDVHAQINVEHTIFGADGGDQGWREDDLGPEIPTRAGAPSHIGRVVGLGVQGLDFKLLTPGIGFKPALDAHAVAADQNLLQAPGADDQIKVLRAIGVGAGNEAQCHTGCVQYVALIGRAIDFNHQAASGRLADLGVVETILRQFTGQILRRGSRHQSAGLQARVLAGAGICLFRAVQRNADAKAGPLRAGYGVIAQAAVVVEPGAETGVGNRRRYRSRSPTVATNFLHAQLTPVVEVPGERTKVAIEHGVIGRRVGAAHSEVDVVKRLGSHRVVRPEKSGGTTKIVDAKSQMGIVLFKPVNGRRPLE